MKAEDLKLIVQEQYGDVALQSKEQNQSSCCGTTGCCSDMDYTIFSENYEKLDGYNADADLGLGCGIPTEFAGIQEGYSVLDLGSGAGNDCFVARALVKESGKVTGLDFTDNMLEKARANNAKMGFTNVEFVKGDIDNMPFDDAQYDVIISNCVLNLVPDKDKAFAEVYRVLKPGAHFCVSDVVLDGDLPESLKDAAEMYAGCVSGAIQKQDYLDIISAKGFKDIALEKEKTISIPDEVLEKYMSAEELSTYKTSNVKILSVTVKAVK